jgi:hypothetical protein
MRRFYTEWEPTFQNAHAQNTLAGWARAAVTKIRVVGRQAPSPLFWLLSAAFALSLMRHLSTQFLILCLSVFVCGVLFQTYYQDHYFGPIAALMAAIHMTSLRRLYALRLGSRRIGRLLVSFVIVYSFLVPLQGRGLTKLVGLANWTSGLVFPYQRNEVRRQLQSMPGSHVVLVRYSANHNVLDEWVYNTADIDSSKVVWAREMSPAQNWRLIQYYRDRTVWLLEADATPPRLQRYQW